MKSASVIIKPRYTISDVAINDAVNYEREPESTQKALAAVGFLLDWAAQQMDPNIIDGSVDPAVFAGLGVIVRHCAKKVGSLYTDEDVTDLGGHPFDREEIRKMDQEGKHL